MECGIKSALQNVVWTFRSALKRRPEGLHYIFFAQPDDILIDAAQHVWVADGTNAKVLEYDQHGVLLSSWGTYGMFPGGFWELHQMSVDADGNLYGADSFGGRTQKFRPRAGADQSKIISMR